MSRPAWLATTAVIAASALLASGCSGGKGRAEPEPASTTTTVALTPTRQVTVHPPGGAPITIGIRPSPDGTLRVGFDPGESGDAGRRWHFAAWDAVAAATLLTGAPPANRELDFTAAGPITGSSAGALMTVAVIALMRGDALGPGSVPAGAVGPDGTIEPSRSAPGASSPSDVYDAYQLMTGRVLPRLPAPLNTSLSDRAISALRLRGEQWTARYDAASRAFDRLAPAVRQDLAAYAAAARRAESQAKSLSARGVTAGAFVQAVNAAAFMGAIARVGQSFRILLGRGVQPFVARIKAGRSLTHEIAALGRSLNAFEPQTVTDAGALEAAYSNAIDAVSFSQLAQALFGSHGATPQDTLAGVAQGAVYFELADTLVDAAHDVLAAGRGLGGPALAPNVDKPGLANFLRHAAEADLDAFGSAVIEPAARVQHVSEESEADALARVDSQFALARSGAAVISALPAPLDGVVSDYGELGGAITLYARTTALLAKYSVFGRLKPGTLELDGIADPGGFNSAIMFAQTQLGANIGWLRAHGIDPVIAVAAYDVAGVDQNGDASGAFDALGGYWEGYLNSRSLAYLGGFASPAAPHASSSLRG
jgi:hypothetical protein